MSKNKVVELLEAGTAELKKIGLSEQLTAETIAESIGMRRNTVSQYLNELVKNGIAFKVKSRPAYFFDKTLFAATFFLPQHAVYENLSELLDEERTSRFETAVDSFDELIGSRGSMEEVIGQIKSSIHYPGVGLPFMLVGETGVGKSHIAKTTYDYCINKGLLNEGAPFVELNCAQYAHNPELLSSILFGYKKGAFTGADQDREGVLEAANHGILFLDEAHRLDPESQEKLFTFIDKQTFQRVGENEKTRKSEVRLIFATTENIHETFLRTFVRRIPIIITVPSLMQRSKQELAEYIYTFFIQEAAKLKHTLIVSPWIFNRMLSLPYHDNVGELRNIVKQICANAFSRNPLVPAIFINSDALENRLLSKFLGIKEIDNVQNKELKFQPDSQLAEYVNLKTNEQTLVVEVVKVFGELLGTYKQNMITTAYLTTQLAREAATVIDSFVNEKNEEKDASFQFLVTTIKDLLRFVETNNFIKIKGNSIIALSSYLYKRSRFATKFPVLSTATIEELNQYAQSELLVETKLLNALLELIEMKLDVTLAEEEKLLLVFYLKSLDLELKQPDMHGVVIAHGFSTASSIADVVNRFLDSHIFDAFDMPFNVTADKVEEYMIRYLEANDCSKGLIMLVDMGSLLSLSKKLITFSKGPILIIDNVTTQQALFVGEMIGKENDLQVIGEKITANMQMTYAIDYPETTKPPLIITVCHTGLGAAQQLKTFLDSSLPEELNYQVEAADYGYLKKYGRNNSMFKQYNVKVIIGTADPQVEGVPYISLEDLISGQGEETVDEIFAEVKDSRIRKEINDNLVRNLSIERLVSAITILDVKKVIGFVDNSLQDIERRLGIELGNNKKAILYVHIAGLVERLIRNSEEVVYRAANKEAARLSRIPIIAQALQPIEVAYNIKISEYELNYLYDIIFDI